MTGGFALLGICLLIGKFAGSSSAARARAALAFIPLWLIGAGVNMWVGVAKAGYAVREELPIAAIAYYILQNLIVKEQGGKATKLAQALGKDWKGKLSPVLYAAAIGLSFIQPWMAGSLYVFVALMWLVPDKRIERVVQE